MWKSRMCFHSAPPFPNLDLHIESRLVFMLPEFLAPSHWEDLPSSHLHVLGGSLLDILRRSKDSKNCR